eukprot:Hpha_TRINITY_DN6686_c0_g1::TRINITY_DN6686_c0_g1_i1::g.26600::m.26600
MEGKRRLAVESKSDGKLTFRRREKPTEASPPPAAAGPPRFTKGPGGVQRASGADGEAEGSSGVEEVSTGKRSRGADGRAKRHRRTEDGGVSTKSLKSAATQQMAQAEEAAAREQRAARRAAKAEAAAAEARREDRRARKLFQLEERELKVTDKDRKSKRKASGAEPDNVFNRSSRQTLANPFEEVGRKRKADVGDDTAKKPRTRERTRSPPKGAAGAPRRAQPLGQDPEAARKEVMLRIQLLQSLQAVSKAPPQPAVPQPPPRSPFDPPASRRLPPAAQRTPSPERPPRTTEPPADDEVSSLYFSEGEEDEDEVRAAPQKAKKE